VLSGLRAEGSHIMRRDARLKLQCHSRNSDFLVDILEDAQVSLKAECPLNSLRGFKSIIYCHRGKAKARDDGLIRINSGNARIFFAAASAPERISLPSYKIFTQCARGTGILLLQVFN
jgi:hypothetical protein